MTPRRMAAAGAALAALAVPTASAAENPPSIRGIAVHDVQVSSGGCQDIPITFRFDAAGWRVDGINAGVSYRGDQVGYVAAQPDEGASVASTTVRWCTSSGLGRFTVGPSQITYRNPQGSGTKSADDQTTGSFVVRRASRVRLVKHSVSGGSAATVTARLRAFSLDSGRFAGVRGVVVDLQTRRAGGRWSTAGTAVTGAHGTAKLSAAGKTQWRVASHATETVARSMSGTF